MLYKAWYGKSWNLNEAQSYIFVKNVEASSLEDAYQKMQGEIWSPNGEAREMILSLGLKHTSMSVGDVLEDENGILYLIEFFGFKKITEFPKKVVRL